MFMGVDEPLDATSEANLSSGTNIDGLFSPGFRGPLLTAEGELVS